MPGTILSSLHILTHLIIKKKKNLCGRYIFNLFCKKKTGGREIKSLAQDTQNHINLKNSENLGLNLQAAPFLDKAAYSPWKSQANHLYMMRSIAWHGLTSCVTLTWNPHSWNNLPPHCLIKILEVNFKTSQQQLVKINVSNLLHLAELTYYKSV